MVFNRVKRTRETVNWMNSQGRKSSYEWTERVKGKRNRAEIEGSVDAVAGKGSHGFLGGRRSKERGVYCDFEVRTDSDGQIYHVKKANINPHRGNRGRFRGITMRG